MARMEGGEGEGGGSYGDLAWTTVRQRPLGKPRGRCQDNIKMDLNVTGL